MEAGLRRKQRICLYLKETPQKQRTKRSGADDRDLAPMFIGREKAGENAARPTQRSREMLTGMGDWTLLAPATAGKMITNTQANLKGGLTSLLPFASVCVTQ